MIETFKLSHGPCDKIVRTKLVTFNADSKTRRNIYTLPSKFTNTSKFEHYITIVCLVGTMHPILSIYNKNKTYFDNYQ